MKNAVAFFGLTRSLDVTSQNLKDSIVKDHDLFVHTWKLNSKSENWHKSKEPSILKTLNNYKKVRLLHSNLTSLYIEKQDVHEPEFCFWGDQKIYYSNQLNMWTSFARVAKLVLERQMTYEEYDFALFTRSDIFFNRPLPQEFMEKAKSRVVFAGNQVNSTYTAEDLIIGVPVYALKKMILFPELYSKYIASILENNYVKDLQVENFILFALQECSIEYEYFPFRYGEDFQIIREGSRQWLMYKILNIFKFWK